MANEVLIQDVAGSSLAQIRFFVTGSFVPADSATDWTIGTPTDVVLTLAAVAAGAGRQSTKVDLGAVRAPSYSVLGCVDFTGEAAMVSGELIEYWWLPSTHTTAANGNVAGNSGVDGDAPAGPVPAGITLAEFKVMGIYIGALVITDDGAVQNGYVGTFSPPTRYGQLLVINATTDAFEADDVEMHQVMNPIVHEIQ